MQIGSWQSILDATKKIFLLLVLLLNLNPVDCHGSHHDHSIDPEKGLHDPKLASKEHISEHLQEQAQLNFTGMTEEEREFYYFKLHDLNNDTKLDGLEIFKSVKHSIDHEKELEAGKPSSDKRDQMNDEDISKIIDRILSTEDSNNDGYISWLEFVAGRSRDKKRDKERESDK